MRLAYAIPADAAEVSEHGKISMLGGEIYDIYAPAFPAFPINLALVVKLLLEPEEAQKAHLIRMDVMDPQGQIVFPQMSASFSPKDTGERPIRCLFVLNLPFLVFPSPGEYHCRLFVDDESVPLDTVPIRLRPTSEIGANT